MCLCVCVFKVQSNSLYTDFFSCIILHRLSGTARERPASKTRGAQKIERKGKRSRSCTGDMEAEPQRYGGHDGDAPFGCNQSSYSNAGQLIIQASYLHGYPHLDSTTLNYERGVSGSAATTLHGRPHSLSWHEYDVVWHESINTVR